LPAATDRKRGIVEYCVIVKRAERLPFLNLNWEVPYYGKHAKLVFTYPDFSV